MADESFRILRRTTVVDGIFVEHSENTAAEFFEQRSRLATAVISVLRGLRSSVKVLCCVGVDASATVSDPESLYGERVIFHQQTDVMKGLIRERSEVTITTDTVALKQEDTLRGFPSLPIRQRRKEMDRRLVRGYDAGLVVPSCWQLCQILLGFIFACVSLFGGLEEYLMNIPAWVMSADIKEVASATRFFGGACGQMRSNCRGVDMTLSEALGLPHIPKPGEEPSQAKPRNLLHMQKAYKATQDHEGMKGKWPTLGMKSKGRTPCIDFPYYSDEEGSDCSAYAKPGWRLSCASTGPSSAISSIRQSRVDKVFGLSPNIACCICGGGEAKAKHMVSSNLAGVLLPVSLMHPHAAPDLGSASALIATLQSYSSIDLSRFGKLLAALPVDKFAMDASTLPLEVSELLMQLQSTYREAPSLLQESQLISESSISNDWQLRSLTKFRGSLAPENENRSQQKSTDAQEAKGNPVVQIYYRPLRWSDTYSSLKWFERVSPTVLIAMALGFRNVVAIRCVVHLALVLGLIHSMLRLLNWLTERFVCSRIYVLLKVDEHCFGKASAPSLWQQLLWKHTITDALGFYLPDATWYPGRLPAFSSTLIAEEAPYQLELELYHGLES